MVSDSFRSDSPRIQYMVKWVEDVDSNKISAANSVLHIKYMRMERWTETEMETEYDYRIVWYECITKRGEYGNGNYGMNFVVAMEMGIRIRVGCDGVEYINDADWLTKMWMKMIITKLDLIYIADLNRLS